MCDRGEMLNCAVGLAVFRKLVRLAAFCLASSTLLQAFASQDSRSATGQLSSDYIRKNLTVEDGLSSNAVYTVLQTKDDFLWVGTREALLRFDGRHFTSFKYLPQGSPGTSVNALVEAPDGALWVGTSAGIARISRGSLKQLGSSSSEFYHLGSQYSDSVQCFHFGKDGTLWVGTGAGLYRWNQGKFLPVIPNLWISRVEESANGHLLLITSHGFVEWDQGQVVKHPKLLAQLGVRPNQVFHVFQDHRGVFWYCTWRGVARQSGDSVERMQPYGVLGRPAAFRAYEDNHGVMWFTESDGLYGVEGSRMKLFADLHTKHMIFDHEGDLWVATDGGGLFQFKPRYAKIFTRADGLPNGIQMATLSASDGKMWIGSDCGGLSWFDGRRFQTYDEKDGLSNSCIFSLAEDADKAIWIGTWGGGVFRYRGGRFSRLVEPARDIERVTLAIIPARDGSVWIAYSDGLSRMKNEQIRNFTTADGLSSSRILSAYEDRHGTIWVETSAGIDRLNGERFVSVASSRNTLVREGRLGFGEDQFGQLFAFALQNGVVQIEGSRFINISGVPEFTGMVNSRQDTWFCGAGVYRASADSLRRWSTKGDLPPDYTRFGPSDGLSSPECSGGFPNMAVASDGRLWVAMDRTIAVLDPSKLRHNYRLPSLYVEKVVVGRNVQSPDRELKVAAGTHHVELHFAAVELASPEKIRLQYRLDGVEHEWLDADVTSTAIYTGLPIGTHSFHLRACNSDGIWEREGIVYSITQKPYYYETVFFRAAIAIIFALLLVTAYRLKLRQVAAKIDAQFRARAAERERIARELHDTLLQGYLSASLHVQAAFGRLEESSTAKQPLSRAIEIMGRASEESRVVLRELRSSELGSESLEQAFGRIPVELARSHRTQLLIRSNGQPQKLRIDVKEDVFRIGREAIVNAFTHSGATQIDVETEYTANWFRLVVRDDGHGISAQTVQFGREGHWGLKGITERATRIGAALSLNSSPEAGTEIVLKIGARLAFEAKNKAGFSVRIKSLFRFSNKEADDC